MSESNSLGKVIKVNLDLQDPFSVKAEMCVNDINIIVGENAAGKSLVMKFTWALSAIASLYVALRISTKSGRSIKISGMKESSSIEKAAQFVLDNTFFEQNFHGSMSIEWERGSISLDINKGKVRNLNIDVPKYVTSVTKCVYMSTSMRLFSEISRHLVLKKTLPNEQILQCYRLYDVLYVETLLSKLPYVMDVEFKRELQAVNITKDIKEIYASDTSILAKLADDQSIDLATLSNGEQAMTHILLAGRLQ